MFVKVTAERDGSATIQILLPQLTDGHGLRRDPPTFDRLSSNRKELSQRCRLDIRLSQGIRVDHARNA